MVRSTDIAILLSYTSRPLEPMPLYIIQYMPLTAQRTGGESPLLTQGKIAAAEGSRADRDDTAAGVRGGVCGLARSHPLYALALVVTGREASGLFGLVSRGAFLLRGCAAFRVSSRGPPMLDVRGGRMMGFPLYPAVCTSNMADTTPLQGQPVRTIKARSMP